MLEKERGATGDDTPSKWQDGNNNPPFNKLPPTNQLIRAGADAPILALCRELLAAGLSPDSATETYRRGLRQS
jgi:hypothetical protein